jgi:hypothetical protein
MVLKTRWSIGGVYAALAVVTTVSTFLLVKIGPTPVLTPNELLTDGVVGLVEVADRINLFVWWISGMILIVMARCCPIEGQVIDVKTKDSSFYIAGVVGAIILAAYTWDFDLTETDNTQSFTIPQLGIGAALFMAYLVVARSDSKISNGLSKSYLLVISFFVVPILWQAPNGVRDPGHFPYTANEMAAVAAGNFPLSDFVPQYSALLSFPIAPILLLFRGTPELVVMLWFITMQVFCIGAPIALAVKSAGWSVLPLGIGVVLIPSIASTFTGGTGSAATYFAGMPLRYVGPIILLVVLWRSLDKTFLQVGPVRMWHSQSIKSTVLVGAICGLVALNNPDFGIPAVISCFVVIIVVSPRLLVGLRQVVIALIGFVIVFLSYSLVGIVIGKPVNWHDWLFFQRVFGSAGFMAMPMPAFGEHLGYVLTFTAGCVIGSVGIARSRNGMTSNSKTRTQRACALLYISLWSLGTLAYFSSRSYASTLWAGHIFQLGLTILFASVYLLGEYSNAKEGREIKRFNLMPPVVALCLSGTLLASLFLRLPSLQDTSVALVNSKSEYPSLAKQAELLSGEEAREMRTGQLLPMSNLVELRTGINSLSLFNHPSNMEVSDLVMSRQCEILLKSKVEFLYYADDSRKLDSHPLCLQLAKTFQTLDPDELMENIAVNQTIKANSGQAFQAILGAGWHTLEQSYVWSSLKSASINLDLRENPKKNLRLILTMRSARTDQEPLKVSINVGGKTLMELQIAERSDFEIELPASLFDDTKLRVFIEVNNPYVPCLESSIQDCRSLGVALEQIKIVDWEDWQVIQDKLLVAKLTP